MINESANLYAVPSHIAKTLIGNKTNLIFVIKNSVTTVHRFDPANRPNIGAKIIFSASKSIASNFSPMARN